MSKRTLLVNDDKLEARIDAIYRSALFEHPLYGKIDTKRVKKIISTALRRIDAFEDAAREDENNRLAIDFDVAKEIGAIWAIAGVGTYDEPVTANDNPQLIYRPWARWMDRDRIDHALLLAQKIARLQCPKVGPMEKPPSQYLPYVIYNGHDTQNAVFEKVIARGDSMLPKEKVKIIYGDLKITVDQIKTFKLPDDDTLAGKEIAIVSHAPHLCRIMHMINKYKPLPPGSVPYLFLLPTPGGGRDEFTQMEVKGLLYYMLLTEDASEDPYPYELRHSGSPHENFRLTR